MKFTQTKKKKTEKGLHINDGDKIDSDFQV